MTQLPVRATCPRCGKVDAVYIRSDDLADLVCRSPHCREGSARPPHAHAPTPPDIKAMSVGDPIGPPPRSNAIMPNWYDQWGTGDQVHAFNYQWEPVPCSCGRSSRHLFVTHWFRLLWMRERW